MKRSNLKLLILIIIIPFFSCEKELNYKIIIPEGQAENSIRNIVAYVTESDRVDTLDVVIKTDSILLITKPILASATPIDISKVKIDLAFNGDYNVTPSLNEPINLTNPVNLSITFPGGEIKTFTVKAVVSKPYVIYPVFNKSTSMLWEKFGNDLNLKYPSEVKGITVVGDYLLVHDVGLDPNANRKIKAYDKLTGVFVKDIANYAEDLDQPRTYVFSLEADNAGHFASMRINSGGAGFMMDYYESIDAKPKLILNCPTNNVPLHTGRKVRIIGNLKEGKAYVYATVAGYLWGTQNGNAQYCVWEFEDGVVKDIVPTLVNYVGAAGWWSASVQQLSLNDPTLYVMYNNELNYPADPIDTWDKITPAAHFEYYTPGSGTEPVKLNVLNHKFRILDNRVFEVNGAKLMAILHQSYSSAGDMSLKLLDLTDPNRLNMKPGDTNYNKFAFFESALVSSKPHNDARYGCIAVDVQGNNAHVYVYFPALQKEDARIQAYKINVIEE